VYEEVVAAAAAAAAAALGQVPSTTAVPYRRVLLPYTHNLVGWVQFPLPNTTNMHVWVCPPVSAATVTQSQQYEPGGCAVL